MLYIMHNPGYDKTITYKLYNDSKETEMGYETANVTWAGDEDIWSTRKPSMNEVRIRNTKAEQAAREDFTKVTIYLPNALAEKISISGPHSNIDTDATNELWDLVKAELPKHIELYVDMRYEYPATDGGRTNRYEIAQLGEAHAIIRRMNTNKAGKKGSRLATTKAKILNDLNEGIAVVVEDDDEG